MAIEIHVEQNVIFSESGALAVTSVAGKTGAVILTKADVGLSNVDNTSDTAKQKTQ